MDNVPTSVIVHLLGNERFPRMGFKMLSTTGGYTIQETENGVALIQNERVITRYTIKQCKNGKWQVRLHGASFGLEIGYFVSADKTFGAVFNQCVTDLNLIIDELLLAKAGA